MEAHAVGWDDSIWSPIFSRPEGPLRPITWALWTSRSQMASAIVGAASISCHVLVGTGTERTSQESPKALRLDLETLELRDRRGHDLRRTFITLAQVDGARRDFLETVTHGPRGDIVTLYTSFSWADLCAEVAKLKIELREGAIIEVPTVPMPATRYTAVTGAERARRRWKFPVTPSGLEPEISP